MIIGGFQKFSLLEYPGKIGTVIFTQGCNFRCSYCHNPCLVDPKRYEEAISEESIMHFLEIRKGKLEAVTISGGEPTIQPDLLDFATKVKQMGYNIKLDTNGSNPGVIRDLVKNELIDYWAMDIKAPLSLYSTICGCSINENHILESMELIRNSGKEWEFRTTYFNQVLNWNDILEIQTLLRNGDNYYLQQCNYNDTLEPIQNPHQTNMELLFDRKAVKSSKTPTHHYAILKETSKLQQIIIKMR
jgi:pyruvate formate lyase activating enzyme